MPDALIYLSRTEWNRLHPRRALLEAAAQERTVVVVEHTTEDRGGPVVRTREQGPIVVTRLVVPAEPGDRANDPVHRDLLRGLLEQLGIDSYVLWLDSPTDLTFTYELVPTATVYACTENVALDADDPTLVLACEEELLREADVVLLDDVTWPELEARLAIAVRIRSAYTGGYYRAMAETVAA